MQKNKEKDNVHEQLLDILGDTNKL